MGKSAELAAGGDPTERVSLGRLIRVTQLARGGMGTVDLALRREGHFRRLYAIKRPHPHLRDDPAFRAMFIDEARLAGLIRHPNVVSVLDVGEDADGAYLVMDYVEGLSLGRLLEGIEPLQARLPLELCFSVVAQVARGLHAAHELAAEDGRPLGLVHRDVSPQNILIGYDGIARMTDFGIAKALGNLSRTTTGLLKGNIGYMSPEQLTFREPDRRSDLFALGVVLFEALTRRRLYPQEEGFHAARRIIEEPPPDVVEERVDVPPAVAALLFELLAKDPALRPTTAREVAARLEGVLSDLQGQRGPFDVTGYLEAHFAARREQQAREIAAALERIESGRYAEPAPAARTASSATQPTKAVAGGHPRGRWRTATLVIASAVLLAGAALLLRGRATRWTAERAGLWAGGWHICALRSEQLRCWGKNADGQLGDLSTTDRSTPVSVRSLGNATWVAVGHTHTCAVVDAKVFCWGSNARGQIGRAAPAMSRSPLAVPGVSDVVTVEAGEDYSCALTRWGRVLCWGASSLGQLGQPEEAAGRGFRSEPREIASLHDVSEIAAGVDHVCARLADGTVVCWGRVQAAPAEGDSGPGEVRPPVPVTGLDDAVAIGAGRNVSYAVRRTGQVVCWGKLCPAQSQQALHAQPVAGLSDVRGIAVGGSFACAFDRQGLVSCWGKGAWGNLGDGTRTNLRLAPVRADVTDVVGLAAGNNFACARQVTGGISCWGLGETGQLGDGRKANRDRPVSVVGFP